MNEKKDIKINTSAFSLTIHWNPQVVGAQFSILFGIMLLKWITKNPNVNTLCTVIIVLDLISVLITIFMGSSIGGEEKEEAEQGSKQPVPPSTPTEGSTAEKGDKKNSKGSEVESNDRVIKRVPMPAQKGVRAPEPVKAAAPEQQPAQVKEPEPEPEPVKENASMEDLSEQELSDLFNW